MSVVFTLNGQERQLRELSEPTLVGLVTHLGLQVDRVAIEQNGVIVARARWADTLIQEADRIELVHFVGGGAPPS